jgi:hypothetical protein
MAVALQQQQQQQQQHTAGAASLSLVPQALPSAFLIPMSTTVAASLAAASPSTPTFVQVYLPDSSASDSPASFSLDFSSAAPRMLVSTDPPIVTPPPHNNSWASVSTPLWLSCYDEPYRNALACLRARVAAQRFMEASMASAPPSRSFVIQDPQYVLSSTCCRCCCLITASSGGGKTSAAVAIGKKLMETRRDWLRQAVVCEYISMRGIAREDSASDRGEEGPELDDAGSSDKRSGSKSRQFEAQLYSCVRRSEQRAVRSASNLFSTQFAVSDS